MRARVVAAALLAALAAPAVTDAQQSRSQAFFRNLLLDDRRTSKAIKGLLRDGGGFVDSSIAFRDVTRDGRSDAVVRVQSGGAQGAVAVYVFSTHGRPRTADLRAIYRRQTLTRATAVVRDGVVTWRTARYAEGDPLDTPSEQVETTLEWDEERDRFIVETRRVITPTAPSDGP